MAKMKRHRKADQKGRRVYLLSPGHLKAMANPLRLEALAIFAERKSSPKEVALELGAKLPTVSYHVKVLEGYGLIKQVDQVPRRGAVEHFYETADPTVLPPGLVAPLVVDDLGAEEVERLRRSFGKALLKVQRDASRRLERKAGSTHE